MEASSDSLCPQERESPALGPTSSNVNQTTEVSSSTDSSNESNGTSQKCTKVEKYNLRRSSVVNRIETEKKLSLPKQPKPKSKPPALSKYRRRAANARERNRMKEINAAFDELQNAVPHIEMPTQSAASNNMTKITTLRLAINYIVALRQILGHEEDLGSDASSTRTSVSSGDESCLSPSDGDFAQSDSCSDGQICLDAIESFLH